MFHFCGTLYHCWKRRRRNCRRDSTLITSTNSIEHNSATNNNNQFYYCAKQKQNSVGFLGQNGLSQNGSLVAYPNFLRLLISSSTSGSTPHSSSMQLSSSGWKSLPLLGLLLLPCSPRPQSWPEAPYFLLLPPNFWTLCLPLRLTSKRACRPFSSPCGDRLPVLPTQTCWDVMAAAPATPPRPHT